MGLVGLALSLRGRVETALLLKGLLFMMIFLIIHMCTVDARIVTDSVLRRG